MSELIWETKVEEKYTCKANRVDASTGLLQIVNDSNGVVIHEEVVYFSQGGSGISLIDVAKWCKICEDTISAQ
jgi:hypothetical protein